MATNTLKPIVLSAGRNSWRMMDAHADESDRRYHELRTKILERDDNTCVYCSFRADKYQEIHHLDDNHGNNRDSNVVTACCLCHQCFHLGMVGVRRSGVIIWAPEFDQGELNNLARTIFIAVTNNGEHSEAARDLYKALEMRAEIVEQELGQGASNPSSIGQAFLEMSPEQYANREARLAGLRLLPKLQSFQAQIAYWRGDPSAYGNLADSAWDQVIPEEMRTATAPLTFAERSGDDEYSDEDDRGSGSQADSGEIEFPFDSDPEDRR